MLVIYAVEKNENETKGFLITTMERVAELKEYKNYNYVSSQYSFIKNINKQNIIPIINKNLLLKTNLKINVDYDIGTKYQYSFKERFDIGNLKVSFDVEATKTESCDDYEFNYEKFEDVNNYFEKDFFNKLYEIIKNKLLKI